MESWSAASRSAVQNAFNALRETIGRELQNEVEHRLREEGRSRELLTEELEILRSRSAEVDRLEDENRKLRTKLLQFHQQSRTIDSPRETPRPNAQMRDQATNTEPPSTGSLTTGQNTDQILRESHKLHRKYNAIDQNFKVLKAEFQRRRDENKQWKQYAERLEEKVKMIEGSRGEPNGMVMHTTQALSEPARPPIDAASSFTSEPGAEAITTDPAIETPANEPAEPAIASARDVEARDLPPTDSTEGETTEGSKDADALTLPPLRQTTNFPSEVYVKSEPSSDGPVFVSERHVGKRKRPVDAIADEPGRQRPKIESSSLSAGDLPSTQIQESMDLDEVGQRLSTPRKNRHTDAERANTTEPVFVRPDDAETPISRPPNSTTVLTPVNPNARLLRPYERKTVEKPTKKGLAQGIGTLAEDGLVYKKSGRGEPAGQFRTPQPPGRLSTLLNMPSPEQVHAIVRSAPRLRDTNRLNNDGPLFPERRELPFNKERREKANPTRRKNDDETVERSPACGAAGSRAAAGTLLPPKASLRSKPVASLRLDDFKINPKFNDGSDYAYSEVVRGKDDRSCLPGCIDMNCCGKHFRAMALAQKNNADRTTASDNKLFEDYLGDRISTVWGISKAEKEDLWVEAKTWQLANDLGKHRHRYTRRSSPPGFWNADFPSTQEVQVEKAEAETRERIMIQERYRDATRGGGRWVFRDE